MKDDTRFGAHGDNQWRTRKSLKSTDNARADIDDYNGAQQRDSSRRGRAGNRRRRNQPRDIQVLQKQTRILVLTVAPRRKTGNRRQYRR